MNNKLVFTFALLLSANYALADGANYSVSITNITRAQLFTPQFVATHDGAVHIFSVGKPASEPLAILAESGNTVPLTEVAHAFPANIGHVQTIPGLLAPGETATVEIDSSNGDHYLSLVAMLIPTNDTFVALNAVELPEQGSVSYIAQAYDAGTEENDQNCAHIPGPRCGGEDSSPVSDKDEGFIYISNGFHDLGSADDEGNEILSPGVYDWRNPVAQITITRIDNN